MAKAVVEGYESEKTMKEMSEGDYAIIVSSVSQYRGMVVVKIDDKVVSLDDTSIYWRGNSNIKVEILPKGAKITIEV